MAKTNCAWSIHDEINYMNSIGKHHNATKDIPRSEMLKLYISAQQKRTHWGKLDRAEVMKIALRLLQDSVINDVESPHERNQFD